VAFNPLEWLNVARTIDRLLALETKHAALIEAQAKEIQALEDRVAKLEAREEILIAEARGAAAAAASGVASQHVAGLARDLGALEERVRNLDRLSAAPVEARLGLKRRFRAYSSWRSALIKHESRSRSGESAVYRPVGKGADPGHQWAANLTLPARDPTRAA
jgi:hypothetical protein